MRISIGNQQKKNVQIYLGEYKKHMLHLIVLNKRTNDITKKNNTDRNEFGPMRYCDTKKELVFEFGFLIVSDFSSNQMNEYLIRSSPNFDTGIRLDPTISAMKNS